MKAPDGVLCPFFVAGGEGGVNGAVVVPLGVAVLVVVLVLAVVEPETPVDPVGVVEVVVPPQFTAHVVVEQSEIQPVVVVVEQFAVQVVLVVQSDVQPVVVVVVPAQLVLLLPESLPPLPLPLPVFPD